MNLCRKHDYIELLTVRWVDGGRAGGLIFLVVMRVPGVTEGGVEDIMASRWWCGTLVNNYLPIRWFFSSMLRFKISCTSDTTTLFI